MTESANPEQTFAMTTAELLELFVTGHFEIQGRMPESSNLTLLVKVSDGEEAPALAASGEEGKTKLLSEIVDTNQEPDTRSTSHLAIYKPGEGERPLRDFPAGLYRREVAMFEVSAALGWDVIPPTAIVDGPLGEGSAQAFVDANFAHHYFSLLEAGLGDDDLRKLCVLDFIANNTDRKSGHCLQAKNGRVLGIDHGLTFHAQFKLRTVMWDYVDEPLGEQTLADIEKLLASDIAKTLSELLTSLEVDAVVTRAKALHTAGVFPADDTGGHRWPWPLI